MSRVKVLFALIAVLCLPAVAEAYTINFGAISVVDAETDVDLEGTFLYAAGTGYVPAGGIAAPGYVGSTPTVTFTDADATPGIAIAGAAEYVAGYVLDLSFDGQVGLDFVYNELIYGAFGVDLDVVPGQQYKLQLLIFDGFAGSSRTFDVNIEGALAIDDLNVHDEVQQGDPSTGAMRAGLYTYEFTAGDSQLNMDFINIGQGDPILNGLTLEIVPEPTTMALLLAGGCLTAMRRRK